MRSIRRASAALWEERRESGAGRPTKPTELIHIENLTDLEPYTDDIVEKLNADQRLALLAVADPVGVLREHGYDLSPQAARDLRRHLPRLSRQARDTYLEWLRNNENAAEALEIKVMPRPSGRALLSSDPTLYSTSYNAGTPGGSAEGFDVVAQFTQGLCQRLLQHHYAEARLPRSIYRISGTLYYFRDTDEYDSHKQKIGQADREIHLGQPALEFLAGDASHAQITSPFFAAGFGPAPLKGTAAVKAQLALHKDEHGHPQYVELSFDGLQEGDVALALQTASGAPLPELAQIVRDTYKNFRTASGPTEPHTPITFLLVDGTGLAAQKINVAPGEAQFAVRTPAGASAPVLVVGFNRAERIGSGNLATVPHLIKPGGEVASLNAAGWLEQGLNSGFQKALPVRFDPDTGRKDNNGDMVLKSVVWNYREDGITGNLHAV